MNIFLVPPLASTVFMPSLDNYTLLIIEKVLCVSNVSFKLRYVVLCLMLDETGNARLGVIWIRLRDANVKPRLSSRSAGVAFESQ